jgi:hypothetical protein
MRVGTWSSHGLKPCTSTPWMAGAPALSLKVCARLFMPLRCYKEWPISAKTQRTLMQCTLAWLSNVIGQMKHGPFDAVVLRHWLPQTACPCRVVSNDVKKAWK